MPSRDKDSPKVNQTKILKDLIRFVGFLAEGDYLG